MLTSRQLSFALVIFQNHTDLTFTFIFIDWFNFVSLLIILSDKKKQFYPRIPFFDRFYIFFFKSTSLVRFASLACRIWQILPANHLDIGYRKTSKSPVSPGFLEKKIYSCWASALTEQFAEPFYSLYFCRPT